MKMNTAVFVALALTPVVAIEYPYEAPVERRILLTKHLDAIKPGMSSKAVIELLGNPDEITRLYEPKVKNSKPIGSTMWYILSQQKRSGSENHQKKVAIAIRLDSLATVSRVDRGEWVKK